MTRNSIPGAWAPALFSLAQDAGLIENPMDALVRDFQLKKNSEQAEEQAEMMEMIWLITFVLICRLASCRWCWERSI